jgi:hypothetical protein
VAEAASPLGSPLTETETRARSPARLVWTTLGPKARSALSAAPGVTFLELGQVRLEGIAQPVRLLEARRA